MYAIVTDGAKQYKVSPGDEILLEKAVTPWTQKITLDKVLLLAQDKKVELGSPYLKEVKVNCEVLASLRGPKKIAFKFKRRKSSQTKKGQRQKLVKVLVKEIIAK